MPSIEAIIGKLARAQEGLFRAADAVPADLWKTSQETGAWSAAELVAHLIMVERSIIGTADKMTQKPARLTPPYKRLHFPLALVEARLIRRKTPIPVSPELVREKEAMLGELREVRGRTLVFLKETRNRDLSVYGWRHPFLGRLNFYEWFKFVGSHQIRHTKQMQEIAGNLRKPVGTLQK
jgi:DinB family protein